MKITLDKVMKEKALKGAPIWFKKVLAYLFRGKPPYPMLAPGLFTQLRSRGIPVWYVRTYGCDCVEKKMSLNDDVVFWISLFVCVLVCVCM